MSLQATFHPHNVYGVLIDASVPQQRLRTLHTHILDEIGHHHTARLFVRSAETSITWGGITEPLVTLEVVQQLLEFDQQWDVWINLTPADLPLAPQADIRLFLDSFPGYTFCGTWNGFPVASEGMSEKRWRQSRFDPSLLRQRRDFTGKLRTIPDGSMVPRLNGSTTIVYQGGAYCVFSRAFCTYAAHRRRHAA